MSRTTPPDSVNPADLTASTHGFLKAPLFRHLNKAWCLLKCGLVGLQPAFAVGVRFILAKAFFLAGLTKIQDWEITLLLFTEEYQVPLLPPAWAAVMGTGGELILPVLLFLGLGGRFAALGLFIMNIVAVISYPGLTEAAIKEHFYWGVLFTYLALYGPGNWSIDRLLAKKWFASSTANKA